VAWRRVDAGRGDRLVLAPGRAFGVARAQPGGGFELSWTDGVWTHSVPLPSAEDLFVQPLPDETVSFRARVVFTAAESRGATRSSPQFSSTMSMTSGGSNDCGTGTGASGRQPRCSTMAPRIRSFVAGPIRTSPSVE
jgi:hypothetical protein